jgi:hypothetical protein
MFKIIREHRIWCGAPSTLMAAVAPPPPQLPNKSRRASLGHAPGGGEDVAERGGDILITAGRNPDVQNYQGMPDLVRRAFHLDGRSSAASTTKQAAA